jgi:hypothetical protein
LPGKATTGLTPEQFEALAARVAPLVEWNSDRGRPRALTLDQAIWSALMYFRNNVTQEFIAEVMGTDQSTISRVISALEGPIEKAVKEFVPDLSEETNGRVGVIDGSLCPCWSWADAPELYSGKHKTTGHNHQFVAGLDGDLMHISDPVPGKTHDAKSVAETGVVELLDLANSIGDKGYIGTGIITPFRKPPGAELLDWQKEYNTEINKMRYVIEQAIANFKTWRCMHTDYRRPRNTYLNAFRAVRALHFFILRYA